MGWFSDKKSETASKDAKARANVEKMRQAKKKERGEDRMNPALAKELNDIHRSWGYEGERGWF